MDFLFYAKQVFPVLAIYKLPTTSRNTPISNVLMWPEDETGGFPGNITNVGSVVNITSNSIVKKPFLKMELFVVRGVLVVSELTFWSLLLDV